MEDQRARAQDIVDKIVEAERLGGGFRTYFEHAVDQIEGVLVENAKLKERVKHLDELQAATVAL